MKRKITKKKPLTNKLLIGAGIIAGSWALWKYVLKGYLQPTTSTDANIPAPAIPAPIIPSPVIPAPSVSTIPKKPPFDPTKVLRLNSTPSEELKLSKQAFNSQIEMARRRKNDPKLSINTRKRLDTISKLPLLDLNTKFGKETEEVAKVILGSKTFTYNGVKLQKIEMWKSLGLPNPYK